MFELSRAQVAVEVGKVAVAYGEKVRGKASKWLPVILSVLWDAAGKGKTWSQLKEVEIDGEKIKERTLNRNLGKLPKKNVKKEGNLYILDRDWIKGQILGNLIYGPKDLESIEKSVEKEIQKELVIKARELLEKEGLIHVEGERLVLPGHEAGPPPVGAVVEIPRAGLVYWQRRGWIPKGYKDEKVVMEFQGDKHGLIFPGEPQLR